MGYETSDWPRLREPEPVAATGPTVLVRPAFYALESGGWRDYLTLLHPPWTLWHLSYVVVGAALSPVLHYDRLGATLLGFFLGMGIGAHALDEMAGRPLRTRIPDRVLVALSVAGLAGALALGLAGVIVATPWLLAFVAFGLFLAPAYNLEWFDGRFHSDFWFAFGWGAFPFLTAYVASSEELGWAILPGAIAVYALSLTQRALSRRVRDMRRRVAEIEGEITYKDGSVEQIDHRWSYETEERSLKLLALTVVCVSVATLLART